MTDNTATAQRDALSLEIGRLAAGDQAALAAIYQRTSAKLFGICLRILSDRGEAEDAMQDVYLSIWRRAATFDPDRASPITWLVTIARNRSIDRLRASGRPRPTAPIESAREVADERPDALASVEADQDRSRLLLCVEELEGRQAGAIRSAFFDGTTYAELATTSGVPLGTMKSWVRRGLMKLRECLDR